MVNQYDVATSDRGRTPALPEPNAEGAALLDNADVLARAVHTSPFGIVLSDLDDGTVLYVNEGFSRLTGYSRAEAVGSSAVALGLWVDPAVRIEVIESLHQQGRIEEFEALFRTKSGDTRHFVAALEIAAFDGRDCAIFQFADLTSQRRAEAAQSAAEAQYQALIEQIPAVVYTESLGDSGTYTYISPQAEAIFGFSPAEILAFPGASIERIHPDDRDRVRREGERTTVSGEPFRLEYRLQARDGRWVHVRDEAVLIRDASGTPLHWQGILTDVTEQRQAEQALRHSEERFQALVQNSYEVIIVLDAEGRRRYVSPSITRVLGYDPAELVDGDALDLLHPDDVPILQEALADCVRGAAQTPPLELRYRHRDGGWRYFETVGTNLLHEPAVGGVVLNSRCITARKATEDALRESEARFHGAFDDAPMGLALVTPAPEGRFQQVNRAFCDLLGYTPAELSGMTFQEITHPDDLADDLAQAARLWAGEIDGYRLEKRFLHKEGHAVWAQLTVSAVRDPSGARYAISHVEDISARRHLDMERATMLASEREYTRQLRELAEMRAHLTEMVAHDLRAPVAALRLMTDMLATGELTPAAQAETLQSMRGQIDQMNRLVSDVAASAAAERDDFVVQLQPVALAVLLDGAAVFARTTLTEHDFAMKATPTVQVWCDPERISQVLGNLLGNAATHTPPGTVVSLTAKRHGQHVRFEVTNQGPPIPPEEMELIFEKFGRGRAAVDNRTAGTGLGLYLSRRIVEAHGSELWVNSTLEHGTTFGFDLRVAA
jgi:PAS domain S-box-containing protein